MEFKVVDINGKETGKSVKLNASVFGIEPNEHSIYLDVKQFLANARQGTHKSKERGEINRTTKKAPQAERYRWRSCRFYAFSYPAWWWYCIRSTSS